MTNKDHYVSYRLTLNTDKKKGARIHKILESLDRKDRQTFLCIAVDMLCRELNYEVPEDIWEVMSVVGSKISTLPAPRAEVCEITSESVPDFAPVQSTTEQSEDASSVSSFIMSTLDDFD